VFLLGFLAEETPCEHGENMQTPHRKAREIAHLSTVHSGEDLPPRANSVPCGNQTHDLLAVRLQCKQLSHRASDTLHRCLFPSFTHTYTNQSTYKQTHTHTHTHTHIQFL